MQGKGIDSGASGVDVSMIAYADRVVRVYSVLDTELVIHNDSK